ncbi:MAG: type II secretion system protein [Planctomycetota bacterium]|nr:type II secretion system protein [Planctomycetota bacterium]
MNRKLQQSMRIPCGFTLIEVLVVIGIIALLTGLLMPGIGMVRKSTAATKSQSNLKQWGTGTIMWSNANNDRLPWEGLKDANDMPLNLAQKAYWANAIPPMVGQLPYSKISDDAYNAQTNVPFAGSSDSIFIDPGATTEDSGPWGSGQPGSGGLQRQFYFNYVPNSQLNNTLLERSGQAQYSPKLAMKLSSIARADATILMLEMRSNRRELPGSDVHFGRDLKRHRADWKRFAARHFDGGHMLFADGHVAWVLNSEATRNSQGSRDPNFAGGDWNTNKLVWDPMGPATDE